MSKVLVIIPAFNEEASIATVIEEIRKWQPGAHIVVVNDGSTDNTEGVARKCGVKVLNLPINLGIGGAVQTGFRYGLKMGFEVAVQVDADGQHNPEYIIHLIEPIISGQAEVVIGSRFKEKRGYQSSLFRRIGMFLLRMTILLVTGKRISDCTSGFRAYSKKALHYLARYYPYEYPEPEIIPFLVYSNLNIKEVAIEMRERRGGKSSITIFHSLYYVFKVFLSIVMMFLSKKNIEGGGLGNV